MNELDFIELPADWTEDDREVYLVPEGNYQVLVERISQVPGGRVVVEMKILDDGSCASKKLFASYTLGTPAGKRLFKEILAAIGVQPEGTVLTPSLCKNKLLDVTVKHNARDGKMYANVVEHRACTA
ncbi:MAG TPA: hypothetical protein PLJ47_09475 [Candidatus Hydrogenedentes bacterium]|nr:hypothetical protein [Candidatus Hydrogenedentota bacterium]HRK34811.1 hypothetical protein [Candidatus Hydrogenedentota bacterium]